MLESQQDRTYRPRGAPEKPSHSAFPIQHTTL